MIIKKREIPIIILQLEALYERLPSEHVKRASIKESLLKRRAGYKGERAVDYILNSSRKKISPY